MRYPVSKPYLQGNELKYVTDAVKDGWLSWKGPFVAEAEKAYAYMRGHKYFEMWQQDEDPSGWNIVKWY